MLGRKQSESMAACKSSLMFVFLMHEHMTTCIYRRVYLDLILSCETRVL